ncbi:MULTISPECIES: hypothetical protein [Acinetobacter]|uniref:hypothetical protein n=1 Tax=Acinetobacter TaxID=469 RepID=UPI0015D16CD2|nr:MULTISPECIES: hypothetical protein [Acinetobacter]MCL6237952.1 hypothetical protein [Acinetobacter amyesii]UIJ75300.1 hypothetical protein LXF01_13980 [Acinetobacter sp. SH20PTE14]
MKINFEVIQYSSGYYSGLNIQIIPFNLDQNPNLQNSIVIDELAFSLIEKFFFEHESPWSHWGPTYVYPEKITTIIERLNHYKNYLNEKKFLTYKDNVQLLFKKETKNFRKKFPKYKTKVITMINQVIGFLKNIQINKIDGITVIGV